MTENYEYLADLTINRKTGLYNLFLTTYNGSKVTLDVFICERKHEMRMDKISNEIYDTTKYVGTLCQLNNIINPFSIKQGDILLFTTKEEADGLRKVANDIKQTDMDDLFDRVKGDLINAYKKRRKDPNGRNFFNRRPNNDFLPPTVLPDNSPQIVLDNNKIKVAPNLFSNPNLGNGNGTGNGFGNGVGSGSGTGSGNGIGSGIGSNNGSGGNNNNGNQGNNNNNGNNVSDGTNNLDNNNGGNQGDNIERVLVRRYIRKINNNR